MKIAILNECFFETSHLTRLKKLGEVTVYPNTTTEEAVIERLKHADVGIVDMFIVPITRKILDHCKNLKLLAVNSTGYDKVDIKQARKRNVAVSHTPHYSTDAVAEQTIALLFAVNRRIVMGDKEFRHSLLEIDPANTHHQKYLGFNLRGKTIGIIGCGNIGTRVVQLAQGLGMNVLIYNRTKKNIPGAKSVNLKQLLQESDIVSLHIALNTETENLIGATEFALMRPHAILLNTASGEVVNTDALYDALKNGIIAGAGLDCVNKLTKDHPLLKLDNVVFSPSSAWYTKETLRNMAETITKTVESFSKGKPINIVN